MPRIQFKGKEFIQNYHLTVKHHELVPKKDKSLTDKVSLHDNLIIHGDNLKALKALLPLYAGKVKCIYIDPPYNTGNEKWAYNDNVNSPMMQDWLGKVVDKEDLTRHDKWLCMMMPRLKLLRELLSEDGAIFISIDDNEQHRLRMLMDEIFGEDNFLANIIWQKKYAASNDASGIAVMHDFVMVYRKSENFERNLFPRTSSADAAYIHNDNDKKGLWRSDNLLVKSFSNSGVFPIVNPNTDKKYLPPEGKCWRGSKETIDRWLKEGRIFFGKDGNGAPQLKRYLAEVQQGSVPTTWWTFNVVGHNDKAKKEIEEIFNLKSPFETPKPTMLLKRIIQLATDKNSIILDSFAGSGTTAHAVSDFNKEDGGNRKFILVECEDYADKITAERVRRVIKGYKKTSHPEQSEGSQSLLDTRDSSAAPQNDRAGTGGTFSYFDLGKPIELEEILTGKELPSYKEMAKYIFYTATGEEFDESKVDESKNYVGESRNYQVFFFYKPSIKYLKQTSLTAEIAENLGTYSGKKRLVFAPTKYLSQSQLDELHIDFAQLPFEIYKLAE